MRIASLLGMTVAEAKRRISVDEFFDWQAMFLHEPWGRAHCSLQNAFIAATLVRALTGQKMKPEAFMNNAPPDPDEVQIKDQFPHWTPIKTATFQRQREDENFKRMNAKGH